MIFSTNTFVPQQKFGAIDGVKKIIEAGFLYDYSTHSILSRNSF